MSDDDSSTTSSASNDDVSCSEEEFIAEYFFGFEDEIFRSGDSSRHSQHRYPRLPKRTRPFTGREKVEDILDGHPERSYELFRLRADTIHILDYVLTTMTGLKCCEYIGTEEQICIFLYTVAHSAPNRVVAEEFQHSGETISQRFHEVLDTLKSIVTEYIQLPPADTGCHPLIAGDNRFYPYFKDALGAIDGTHIPAIVKQSKHNRYRCRKNFISQNVMAACSFDNKFLFVAVGVEGSATDMRVLRMCLEGGSFSVPPGKYYLVDCGYANTISFLAPYRGIRYHLSEYSTGRQRQYRNLKEKFNHRHAQLCNVVERTFGVLKQRFKILRAPQPFMFSTQRDIVIACCVLHNFIHRHVEGDEDLTTSDDDDDFPEDDEVVNIDPPHMAGTTESQRGEALRNSIAEALWIGDV